MKDGKMIEISYYVLFFLSFYLGSMFKIIFDGQSDNQLFREPDLSFEVYD
jgi:hypothetical protein